MLCHMVEMMLNDEDHTGLYLWAYLPSLKYLSVMLIKRPKSANE